MNKEHSELFLHKSKLVTEEYCQLLREIESSCDAQEYYEAKQIVGSILATIYRSGMSPIYKKYPDLKPHDLDS